MHANVEANGREVAMNQEGLQPDAGGMASARSSNSGLLFVADLRRMFPALGADAVYGLLRSQTIACKKVANRYVTTPAAVERWLSSITNGIDMGDPFAASKERES